MKKLSTGLIVLIVVLALLVVFAVSVGATYNGMATSREAVNTSLGSIQTQLQRRADLIPNLVETVKGYAAHESAVIKSVSDARAKLAGASNVNDMANSNAELSSALSRLLVVVENYPDLKANQNFIALTDELAGTENRVAVARNDYNQAVKKYNSLLIQFPANIVAGMFNFEKADYFQAQEGTQNAPQVNFK